MAITMKAFDVALQDLDGKAHVVLVEDGFKLEGSLKEVGERHFSNIAELIQEQKFTGKQSEQLIVPSALDGVSYFIMVGVGKPKKSGNLSIEGLRRAMGTVVRILQAKSIPSMALQLPACSRYDKTGDYIGQQVASIIAMATYKFDSYITEESRHPEKTIEVNLSVKDENQEAFNHGIEKGLEVGTAVNLARQWVNTPPSDLTPAGFAEIAQDMTKDTDVKCTVFDDQKAKQLGMGGLLGVSRGSLEECRFVLMEYKVSDDAPTIGLVGKGITFDSGGLSLKPPAYMETMKEDMSGAAAVIATMKVVGKIKPNVNVIAAVPMAENLPSGDATKPGDILKFYNGKTAEVKNTDAEGRLILADALSYITKNYKLDALLDIATLTGACAYALGPYFTGMMGFDEDLMDTVKQAGCNSGDKVWRLPLDSDYTAAIKSEVADLCNIGKKSVQAGASTAGAFLAAFVENDTPWVHLDIAGTAFNVPGVSYYRPETATGVGVRLFVDLIDNWA